MEGTRSLSGDGPFLGIRLGSETRPSPMIRRAEGATCSWSGLEKAYGEERHLDAGHNTETLPEVSARHAVCVEPLAEDHEDQTDGTQDENAKLIDGFHRPMVKRSRTVDSTASLRHSDAQPEQEPSCGYDVDNG